MSSDAGTRPPVDERQPQERHPNDLLASYLLDALDEQELAAVETHVSGCAQCRADLAELRAAVDALPFAVVPLAPPPAAREALMARIRAGVSEPAPAAAAARAAPWWQGRLGTTAGWTSAASTAVVAAFSLWQLGDARRELAVARNEAAEVQAAYVRQLEVLGTLNPATTRVSAVRGTSAATGAAGRLLYDPGGRTALVVLERLPPLEPGTVYQLWLLQGSTPTSAGTFTVDQRGLGTLVIQAPAALGAFSGLGLTAEPDPGQPAPTGRLLASGTL